MSMRVLFAIIAATAALVLGAQSVLPQEGDLLFVSPPKPNAITQSTSQAGSSAGTDYDHVGIFHLIGGAVPCVVEATPPKVCITPLDTFLTQNPCTTLARVNVPFNTTATIAKALSFVGRPYDFYFEPSDSALYCSELVQKSYVTPSGKPLFGTIAMSFHGPDGKILDYWVRRYAAHGKHVPEGEPGTNPNELLHRSQITILGRMSASVK